MVSFFGFGIPKCAYCGMKLGEQFYEWEDKKFCCQECKKSYRHKKSKGSGSCH